MAIVTEGNSGRNYYSPTQMHERIAEVDIPENVPYTTLPDQALGFRVQIYGMTHHRDLFSARQLVALTTFSDLVQEVVRKIQSDAIQTGMTDDETPLRDTGIGSLGYAEAVGVYLGFVLDRSADFWGALAFWANQPKNELVMHVFGRHALPMVWDFAEANPFSESGGNWLGNLGYVSKAIEFIRPASSHGIAVQADATKLDHFEFPLLISSDPPYYDNIGYADLSDYFYVWMRRTLQNIFPTVFSTVLVPKTPEFIASPYRFDGDRDAANTHFEEGLVLAFEKQRQIAHSAFPLTVYYAFKQTEIAVSDDAEGGEAISSTGWETMLQALINAGFIINGTWPIRTERSGGFRNFNQNALASSIVLVCRPRPADAPQTSRREFVNALRRELPEALRDMQSGSIAPVDLA